EATAYVIDPTRSGSVAEAILGLDYDGTLIHDGWSPYDRFENARHQQCLNHLMRRADEMEVTATQGAVGFPRRVAELLRAGLDLRDRHAAGEVSRQGLAVARGRLENQLTDLVFPPKTNAANERLAQHLWNHRADLFTFLRQPGLDATNWRAELAIRFGVILRKVWGGSRTWVGARAQSVLMSVWRTCWQQGGSALGFLSQLLRGTPGAAALPPWPTARTPLCSVAARAILASASPANAGPGGPIALRSYRKCFSPKCEMCGQPAVTHETAEEEEGAATRLTVIRVQRPSPREAAAELGVRRRGS